MREGGREVGRERQGGREQSEAAEKGARSRYRRQADQEMRKFTDEVPRTEHQSAKN